MFLIDKLLLVAGLLMVLGTMTSKFSARLGLPVLVLFMGVGMLAGSEGIGKIPFENYELAHAIGTVALAFILFDGGLRTPTESLRIAWKPSAVLATAGVFVTAAITGVVAMWVLDISLLEGLLLGAIAGSTDAAAVFALLRGAGVRLRPRLAATLEIESGANDPMAIFLTVGLIQILTNQAEPGLGLLQLFAQQMGVGLAVGYGIGQLSLALINRINLSAAGLYPVLTAACGVFAFGLAAVLDGSGFLAIYVAGVVLGNSRMVFRKGTFVFHDGIAWAGQIAMFVVLGLLSFPSALWDVGLSGLLIALALVFVARPLAVVPLLLPFGYDWREHVLISWVGLKGAVPIILAIYPLLFGIPSGPLLFNVVFFVVLLSAITQGTTLPWMARVLKLDLPPEPVAPISLEISSLRDVDAEIVDYLVHPGSRAAGRSLRDLALPEGAVAAMITRGGFLIPPRGSSLVHAGDHVFVVVNGEARRAVDRIFSLDATCAVARDCGEIRLRGTTTVRSLGQTWDVHLDAPPDRTLEEIFLAVNPRPVEDDVIHIHPVRLRAAELRDGHVLSIGLTVIDPELDGII